MPRRGERLEEQMAELLHCVDVGFARTDGKADLLLQRLEQSDKRQDLQDARLDRLERRQWPLPTVAAVAAVGAVVAAVWPHVAH